MQFCNLVYQNSYIVGVNSRDARAWGLIGAVPLLPSKSRGNGGKSALPMLSTGMIFSYFLLTFVLLSHLTLYPQEFIICHEMQQWHQAQFCEK